MMKDAYDKTRDKIARIIAEDIGWQWDDLLERSAKPHPPEALETYRRQAGKIIKLLPELGA